MFPPNRVRGPPPQELVDEASYRWCQSSHKRRESQEHPWPGPRCVARRQPDQEVEVWAEYSFTVCQICGRLERGRQAATVSAWVEMLTTLASSSKLAQKVRLSGGRSW